MFSSHQRAVGMETENEKRRSWCGSLPPPPPPPGTVEGQEKRSDSPIRTLTPAANPCVPPPQLQELGHGAGILGLPIREGLEVAPVLHPCTEHLGMGESHYKKTFFFFF